MWVPLGLTGLAQCPSRTVNAALCIRRSTQPNDRGRSAFRDTSDNWIATSYEVRGRLPVNDKVIMDCPCTYWE